MGFEVHERKSFREGRGANSVPGVRVHGAQMWFTRAITATFLEKGVKTMVLMLDREKQCIRLVPVHSDDLNGFNVLYQVRNQHGDFTRAVINATALLRSLALPTQSCAIEEKDDGYEFVYKVQT